MTSAEADPKRADNFRLFFTAFPTAGQQDLPGRADGAAQGTNVNHQKSSMFPWLCCSDTDFFITNGADTKIIVFHSSTHTSQSVYLINCRLKVLYNNSIKIRKIEVRHTLSAFLVQRSMYINKNFSIKNSKDKDGEGKRCFSRFPIFYKSHFTRK